MSAVRTIGSLLVFYFLATNVVEAQPVTDSLVIDSNQAKPAEDDEDGKTLWYDLQRLTMEGQAWSDTKSPYDRFPARAEATVRPDVWNLSQKSAGILARFSTDATTIHARWTLTSASLAMGHMPSSGVSGLDLYVRHEGRWRWLANGIPTGPTSSLALIEDLPKGERDYLLYLPLYNGVTSVELGIAKEDSIAAAGDRPLDLQKPIVFYGTSITQGGCASRPGMVHTAILGRRFNRPVINLGFSGHGRMETEVVELINEIDAAVFVLDCLPNIEAEEVLARTKLCVDILRADHHETPILLVEDRTYSNSYLRAFRKNRNQSSRAALREVFDELKAAGDENLYYLEGEHLLGDDDEGTVDSSHPTDLGFWRQAGAFQEVLEPILLRRGE